MEVEVEVTTADVVVTLILYVPIYLYIGRRGATRDHLW